MRCEMVRDKYVGFWNSVDEKNGYGDGNDVVVLCCDMH
jgi:hypothetical protein